MLTKGQGTGITQEVAGALLRLIDDAQMGKLFKVVAVTPPSVTTLAGFA
jgi:SAM-dependent MidA family methyltransferase